MKPILLFSLIPTLAIAGETLSRFNGRHLTGWTMDVPARDHMTGKEDVGIEDARRIIKLTDGAEKPAGEWNRMKIVCKGDEIIVHVNGTLVNHGSKSTATSGKIALQVEGSEVEFRKVGLTPQA